MLAFQVRTIIRNGFKDALDKNDILISPAAPSVAYKIGMTSHVIINMCISFMIHHFHCFTKTTWKYS